jgi:hypothetical protein
MFLERAPKFFLARAPKFLKTALTMLADLCFKTDVLILFVIVLKVAVGGQKSVFRTVNVR